jgi:hypothetical protein
MPTERGTTSSEHVGLSVEPDNEAGNGLVLRLGTSRLQCILEPDEADLVAGGRGHGAAQTLDRWLTQLERLVTGGGPVMLPFNFSDQCTGWLRVSPLPDDRVNVQAGWSRLGQYDFDPEDFVAVGSSLSDFTPVPNATITRPLANIVAAVTASRDELVRSLDTEGGNGGD